MRTATVRDTDTARATAIMAVVMRRPLTAADTRPGIRAAATTAAPMSVVCIVRVTPTTAARATMARAIIAATTGAGDRPNERAASTGGPLFLVPLLFGPG